MFDPMSQEWLIYLSIFVVFLFLINNNVFFHSEINKNIFCMPENLFIYLIDWLIDEIDSANRYQVHGDVVFLVFLKDFLHPTSPVDV